MSGIPQTDLIARLHQYEGQTWKISPCNNGLRDEAADEIARLRAERDAPPKESGD